MQSLCTLRDHCRQWPRNTRHQAGATPHLGRTSTGWIAPALRLATSSDHLVGAREDCRRNGQPNRHRCLEVEDQFELRDLFHG